MTHDLFTCQYTLQLQLQYCDDRRKEQPTNRELRLRL